MGFHPRLGADSSIARHLAPSSLFDRRNLLRLLLHEWADYEAEPYFVPAACVRRVQGQARASRALQLRALVMPAEPPSSLIDVAEGEELQLLSLPRTIESHASSLLLVRHQRSGAVCSVKRADLSQISVGLAIKPYG